MLMKCLYTDYKEDLNERNCKDFLMIFLLMLTIIIFINFASNNAGFNNMHIIVLHMEYV